MKKKIVFAVLIIAVFLLSACSGKKKGSASPAAAPRSLAMITEGPYKGMTPLEEVTGLKIGQLAGSIHSVMFYFIQQLGGYETMGIEPEFTSFGNGPIMVEAGTSGGWDMGSYGIGGTLSGTLGYGIYTLAFGCREDGNLRFFIARDSDLAQAGTNVPDAPMLYGTADTWRGKQIYLPTGTTAHYALALGLEKFGLTDSDVVLNHMDVSNVNTALRAGRAEIGGLWTSISYGDINDDFQAILVGSDVNVNLATTIVAAPKAYDDPIKREAIAKTLEMYMLTVDWLLESDENFNQALEWYVDFSTQGGMKTSMEAARAYLGDPTNFYFTLEENYDLFTRKSDDGRMSIAYQMNYDPLVFFIKQGNYREEDAEKFINSGAFKTDILFEIYDRQKNRKN